MAFFVKSNGNALFPTSKAAQDALMALPKGVPMRIDPKQPRNGKQHRLFWAFAQYVANAMNDGPTAKNWTAEDVVSHMKIATGRAVTVRLGKRERDRLGVEYAVLPKSISFASMDNAEFSKFMDAAFMYVRDDLCRWIESSDDWHHIEEILRASGMMGSDAA